MSWSSVALYTLTGTLTSPNAMEPFQMERIVPVCPYHQPGKGSAWRQCGPCDRRSLVVQLSSGHAPRFDAARPLDLDCPAGLAIEFIADQVESIARDLDDAALAVRLHPASHVYGLAPEVVDE